MHMPHGMVLTFARPMHPSSTQRGSPCSGVLPRASAVPSSQPLPPFPGELPAHCLHCHLQDLPAAGLQVVPSATRGQQRPRPQGRCQPDLTCLWRALLGRSSPCIHRGGLPAATSVLPLPSPLPGLSVDEQVCHAPHMSRRRPTAGLQARCVLADSCLGGPWAGGGSTSGRPGCRWVSWDSGAPPHGCVPSCLRRPDFAPASMVTLTESSAVS